MKYLHYILLVAAGFCLCTVSVVQAAKSPATALWTCAGPFERKLDREVASVNVKQYRERFLAGKRDAVHRAMFVFPASYDIMRTHLRSVSEKRFGERKLVEMTALDVIGLSLTSMDGSRQDKAHRGTSALTPEREAKLRDAFEAAGMRPGPTAATRILTGKYNTVPSKEGWSELEILVVDGREILGHDSTLVIMTRRGQRQAMGLGKIQQSLFLRPQSRGKRVCHQHRVQADAAPRQTLQDSVRSIRFCQSGADLWQCSCVARREGLVAGLRGRLRDGGCEGPRALLARIRRHGRFQVSGALIAGFGGRRFL